MEESPLIKAHDHALKASRATQSANTTVAVNEHALAAGEFAKATRHTTSTEALRTLHLLESHHLHLAELLKLRTAPPPVEVDDDDDEDEDDEEEGRPPLRPSLAKDDSTVSTGSAGGDGGSVSDGRKTTTKQKKEKKKDAGGSSSTAAAAAAGKVPSLTARSSGGRNPSSSIASNLASARGIRGKYRGGSGGPAQPLSPSVTNDPASGNLEVQTWRESSRGKMQTMLDRPSSSGGGPGGGSSSKPGWVPPDVSRTASSSSSSSARAKSSDAQARKSPAVEEGYSRFYSQIGTFLGRLPAPLAFAGLPLISEESSNAGDDASESTDQQQQQQQHQQQQPAPAPAQTPTHGSTKRTRLRHQQSSSSSASDEISRYFSKPALRAIEHRSAANDSFYVVPTSGLTMSYANILTFADKEKRRLEASSLHSGGSASLEDDEDFVDAHESPTAAAAAAAAAAAPQLSGTARQRIGKARSERDLRNVVEELCVENGSLKEMLDKVSKRLQTFETSSMRLAESRMLARPGSPASASASTPAISPLAAPPDGSSAAEWQEKWATAQQKIEALERDNDKMQRTLVKYRQKWDSLKETAKARRAQVPTGETSGQS